jgi:hypothetical protein
MTNPAVYEALTAQVLAAVPVGAPGALLLVARRCVAGGRDGRHLQPRRDHGRPTPSRMAVGRALTVGGRRSSRSGGVRQLLDGRALRSLRVLGRGELPARLGGVGAGPQLSELRGPCTAAAASAAGFRVGAADRVHAARHGVRHCGFRDHVAHRLWPAWRSWTSRWASSRRPPRRCPALTPSP